MAPNGSGKTTFFKIITNLQTLDKGKVYNDCSNRKQFSIFDDLSLYKNLTGYQNIQLLPISNLINLKLSNTLRNMRCYRN